jgi:tetratricopeptide (TPR) repeat protein
MKKILFFCVISLVLCSRVVADQNSSEESQKLTKAAWKALDQKDYAAVDYNTDFCITKFSAIAEKQQKSLSSFPEGEKISEYWALNDVATCCFIKGKAMRDQKKFQKAMKLFENIIDKYSYAQCWDPIGWYWKLSDGARDQIIGIKVDIDFENCTSIVLREKVMDCFSKGEYTKALIYVAKCIEMYDKDARTMQSSLKDFARKEDAYNYYALNDVGMCLLIKGKILAKKGYLKEAEVVYQAIVKEYCFAQYFNNEKAEFIKISELAQKELNSLLKDKSPIAASIAPAAPAK